MLRGVERDDDGSIRAMISLADDAADQGAETPQLVHEEAVLRLDPLARGLELGTVHDDGRAIHWACSVTDVALPIAWLDLYPVVVGQSLHLQAV